MSTMNSLKRKRQLFGAALALENQVKKERDPRIRKILKEQIEARREIAGKIEVKRHKRRIR